MKQRIAVGLSGGVDSALSAWLLKRQGHEVVGIFMKNWQDDDDREYCASAADFIDAVAVADVLGIEIEHVNFAAEYKERVFADFLDEYRAGRTPNPDIFCNAEIKFKAFLHHAMQGGFDAIATGHYARLARLDGRVALLKGSDPSKDQSYFLHRLDQAQLARAIFPLGDMHKSRVRELARELKLPNADKKDSTGICFIGERPFRDFLGRYIHSAPGPILDDQGRELGQHLGLPFYTLGQRSGLGIGGVAGALDAPWFVARKELAANVLRVVQGHDHPWLLARRLQAVRPHWICGRAPAPGSVHGCKTRYRQADCPARVLHASDEALELEFDSPQWAVTPGQSVVLYEGDVCLGGAIIAQTD